MNNAKSSFDGWFFQCKNTMFVVWDCLSICVPVQGKGIKMEFLC